MSIEAGSLEVLHRLIDTVGLFLATAALKDELHLLLVLDVRRLILSTTEQSV